MDDRSVLIEKPSKLKVLNFKWSYASSFPERAVSSLPLICPLVFLLRIVQGIYNNNTHLQEGAESK